MKNDVWSLFNNDKSHPVPPMFIWFEIEFVSLAYFVLVYLGICYYFYKLKIVENKSAHTNV